MKTTEDAPATPKVVPTRERVARSILDHGPSTAGDLAQRLGLTQAGVRKHLDHLQAAGHVTAREERIYGHRGRGRPRQVFALTDSGRHAFFTAYDALATDILDFLEAEDGADAVARYARHRAARLVQRYAPEVEGKSEIEAERVEELAALLRRDGYAATVREASSGVQLCQHQCPIARVAEKYPQFCEAEAEAFAELLDLPVRRLATIANGDGVCTTHVSAPDLGDRR